MDRKAQTPGTGTHDEMNLPPANITEQAAALAFNKQAAVFDRLYEDDIIIKYKRQRVRDHISRYLPEGATILELNAGTGEDAIYLAGLEHKVHATDISSEMQAKLATKIQNYQLENKVSHEICSFTELENLAAQGPFDYILSNFAGLNCTNRLDKVLDSFSWLIKPGGYVTLVLLPKFCLWEFLLLFKGKFRTAFRRFSGKKGAKAHIEGEYFRCWYYDPSFIRNHLKNSFIVEGLEGLCTLVPPSYLEGFAAKSPRLFQFLQRMEDRWKNKWPWRRIGDYYIITLRKK